MHSNKLYWQTHTCCNVRTRKSLSETRLNDNGWSSVCQRQRQIDFTIVNPSRLWHTVQLFTVERCRSARVKSLQDGYQGDAGKNHVKGVCCLNFDGLYKIVDRINKLTWIDSCVDGDRTGLSSRIQWQDRGCWSADFMSSTEWPGVLGRVDTVE